MTLKEEGQLNKNLVCLCYSGFLGCEIPASSSPSDAAAGVTNAGLLTLTPQSKLTVINRPDDILLSFHSPSIDPQVISTVFSAC